MSKGKVVKSTYLVGGAKVEGRGGQDRTPIIPLVRETHNPGDQEQGVVSSRSFCGDSRESNFGPVRIAPA